MNYKEIAQKILATPYSERDTEEKLTKLLKEYHKYVWEPDFVKFVYRVRLECMFQNGKNIP